MSLPLIPWCDPNPITIVKITLDYDQSGVPHALLADPCAFVCDPVCFYFSDCKAGEGLALEAAADGAAILPNVQSTNSTGQRLKIGKGLSDRASIQVCFKDVPLCDGSTEGYMSKLITEQCFWENRVMEVFYGDCNAASFADMEKETFLITSAEPGGGNKVACISGRDPLYLLSDNNAVIPQACPFDFVLKDNWAADFDADTGTTPYDMINRFILSENVPIGSADIDCILCASVVCVGSELVRVAPVLNDPAVPLTDGPSNPFGPAGYNLVALERAVCGTSISEHKAGSTVNITETLEQCHVADVLLHLLKTRAQLTDVALLCCNNAGIDITLDCVSLDDFRCKHPLNIVDEFIQCQTVEVSDLLNELAMENLLSIYFDNQTNQIKFEAFCPDDVANQSPPVDVLHCNIVEGGIRPQTDSERYSRVDIGYNPSNWLSLGDEDGWLVATAVDLSSEIDPACDRRKYRTPKTLRHNSRFMGSCGKYRAETLAAQLLCVYEKPRQRVAIRLPPNAACDLLLGTPANILFEGWGAAQQQGWTVVARRRTGRRNCFVEVSFEKVFDTTQPVQLGFACGTPPADNLSAEGACDADCLINL